MRSHDMECVTMRRKGNYLSLVVPGLAERRPSLVQGDDIFVKLADADDKTTPYQVSAHSCKRISCYQELKLQIE